jgi:Tfp pilus assembly protein PilO
MILPLDLTSEIQLIPQSAWVQAVFVCLFIVGFIAVLNWTGKREEKWQSWMASQNKEWRVWMETQDTKNCAALSEISKSVEKMSDQLAEHDRSLEPRIDKAIEKAQANGRKTRKVLVQNTEPN